MTAQPISAAIADAVAAGLILEDRGEVLWVAGPPSEHARGARLLGVKAAVLASLRGRPLEPHRCGRCATDRGRRVSPYWLSDVQLCPTCARHIAALLDQHDAWPPSPFTATEAGAQ